ncbi:hypothetical protein GQ42DRAFT_165721 [Ramicandelaber brevisporus]|nr:hypothetical protein GQ42DRAFT_165721 [Ramicandelaber brevisporus]
MLALRMTTLSALVVVGLVILFNLITGDLIQLFRHPVLFKYVFSYNTIFAVLQVLWFVAFCIFSHLIRVNFDTPLSLIQDAFGEPAFYEQYDEQSQPLQPPQQQQQQRGTTAGGNSGELQQNPDIAASITPQQQHQQQHQQQQQTRSRKHRNTEWVSVVLPPTLPLGALNRNNDQQQQMAPLLCLATPDPADLEFRSQK